MLVDTHAHLTYPQLAGNREALIDRAAAAGVSQIVDVGTSLSVSRGCVSLADPARGVYATAGIHPHDVEKAGPEDLDLLVDLMQHDGVVGVGETGLDFFRDYAPHDLQESTFRWHVRCALDRGLPLVVHSRGAEERVLAILAEEAPAGVAGVLHCFGGTLDQALEGVAMGLCIGLGGTVTFKNSTSLAVALGLPADRLVLETDCPYLAPVPHRGKQNEPAFVRDIAGFLAAQMDEPISALAERTTRTARRLFGLDAN